MLETATPRSPARVRGRCCRSRRRSWRRRGAAGPRRRAARRRPDGRIGDDRVGAGDQLEDAARSASRPPTRSSQLPSSRSRPASGRIRAIATTGLSPAAHAYLSATSRVCAARPSGAALVVEGRVGDADTRRVRDRRRVEADPLAARRASEVDRQVDVDEDEAAEVERRADAVAGVGGDRDPLKRGRLLAGDERMAHPQPRGRRARPRELPGNEPVLHGRVVADVCSVGKNATSRPSAGPGGPRPAAAPRRFPRPPIRARRRGRAPPLPQPPGAGADHLALLVREAGLDELHALARAHDGGIHAHPADRNGRRIS